MQAVADHLGVDRKALHYHIKGRDGLLELVALDLFATHFAEVELPGDDWRAACRTFSVRMAAALVETGELINYFSLDSGTLHVIEKLLDLLRQAGFADEFSKRVLVTLTTLAMGNARDRVLASREGGHPRHSEWRRETGAATGDELPTFVGLGGSDLDVDDEEQLRTSVDILVLGMEKVLHP
jgi:AcrR family transcriptional regulator